MAYKVIVGTKYISSTGLGSRRVALQYETREMAEDAGCMQTCDPYGPGQREAAWALAKQERRFRIEETE